MPQAVRMVKPLTMIRVEGFSDSIKYRTEQLKDLLAPLLPKNAGISIDLDQKQTTADWKQIRDVQAFHGRQGSRLAHFRQAR